MDKKLKFVSASDARVEGLDSFVLEAYIDEKQVADILRIEGKWFVTLMAEGCNEIKISLTDWLELNHRFAQFVNEENELALKELTNK